MDPTLKIRIDKLERDLRELSQRRIGQGMVINGQIKQRHMGEGNLFMRSGLAADRPTVGETVAVNSSPCYFATDTGVLSVWDGTQWLSTTLA